MKKTIKTLLREGLLNEYKVHPYEKIYDDGDDLRYKFDADGVFYYVTFHKKDEDYYDISFSNEKTRIGDRFGKDVKHLYNIMYTVDSITRDVVKEYKVKRFHFFGIRGDDEFDNYDWEAGSIRSRIYIRHIKQNYPEESIEKIDGSDVYIDATKAFPEYFEVEPVPDDNLFYV
jgi:hypothetical protein